MNIYRMHMEVEILKGIVNKTIPKHKYNRSFNKRFINGLRDEYHIISKKRKDILSYLSLLFYALKTERMQKII